MKTNRQRFLEKYRLPPDTTLSLDAIADLTDIPLAALKEVEKRGFGAYNSNLQSVRLKGSFVKGVDAPASMKLSPNQWARARVFSFVMKQPGTFYGADKDIAVEYKLL